MLEELVFLHQNFVSADLATGCHIPAASLVSFRLCSLRMIGPLWPGKQVTIGIVTEALSAVGKAISLAYAGSPINENVDKALVSSLEQTMEVWRKDYPPTKNKFPVGIDVPRR